WALTFDSDKVDIGASAMIPYPMTPLWAQARAEGRKLEGWNGIHDHIGCVGNEFNNPNEVILEMTSFRRRLQIAKDTTEFRKRLHNRKPQAARMAAKLAKEMVIARFPQWDSELKTW